MAVLTDEQRVMLAEPIDRDRVKGREGPNGRTLSYLSQSDVKATANRIFGFCRWSYETLSLDLIGTEPVERTRDNWVEVDGRRRKEGKVTESGTRVAYKAHVRVTVEGVCYTDWGYGDDVSYTSVLQQHELAMKEAVSDALKRCWVAVGDQFGLSLYEEGAAMRSGGGGGARGRRRDSQTGAPPTLTEADLRAVHAERNKYDVSELDLKWLARFVAQMPSLTSMKQFPRASRRDLIDGIRYFASNPADAEAQMKDAGIERPPEDSASAGDTQPDHLGGMDEPDEGGYP